MRKYHNEVYQALEVQAVLQSHGTWNHCARLAPWVRVESGPEGDLVHAGASQHAVSLGLTSSRLALGSLSGRWCSCLSSALTDLSRDTVVGLTDPDRTLLSLAVHEVHLRTALEVFRAKPSTPVRDLLQGSLHPLGPESPLREANLQWVWLAGPGMNPSDSAPARLAGAMHTYRQGVLVEVEKVLTSPELNGAARPVALRRLVSSTWLEHIERDESLVLVGLLRGVRDHLAKDDRVLMEVLSAHTVHQDDVRKMLFYCVPAYVGEYLLRLGPSPALALQVTRWDPEVDLSEVAVLWSPLDTSALCALSRCLEAVRKF